MVDNLDIFMGITGSMICKKISMAVDAKCEIRDIINADTRRSINEIDDQSDCEYIPVNTPTIVCPPNVTLKDEYSSDDIGDPVIIGDIVYGWYNFSSGNPGNPNATDLSDDIAAQPTHYTTEAWSSPLDAQIVSSEICYHLIRIPNTLGTITIRDEANVIVNAAWTLLSDANYVYYLLKAVVAPSTVNYTLT